MQANELVGADTTFVLNAREVDTGRYRPPLLQLNADGTGSIRNSNNQGGVDPATLEVVDVDFGEEYVTELTFTERAAALGLGAGQRAAPRHRPPGYRQDPARTLAGERPRRPVPCSGGESCSRDFSRLKSPAREDWTLRPVASGMHAESLGPHSVWSEARRLQTFRREEQICRRHP